LTRRRRQRSVPWHNTIGLSVIWTLASLSTIGDVLAAHSSAPQGLHLTWTESTPFPEPRSGYCAGSINGKMVIAGGTYWEGTKGHWTKKVYSASTHAFDPQNQTWEKLPDAPIPFGYAACTVVAHKLFVLGGFTPFTPNRRIFTLRRELDHYVWEIFGDMPEDRIFAQAVSVGSKIYLIGGTTEFEPYDSAGTCCTSKTATNTAMVLDTAHRESGWQQLTPYPGAKRWLFAAETDGKSILLFGGIFQARQKDSVTNFNEALRYQLDDARWSVLPSLPAETHGTTPLTALFLNGRVILISSAKRVWQFNLKTLQYDELSPMPDAAFVDKFVLINDSIIGAGGESSEGPRRRSDRTFIGKVEPDRDRPAVVD
jgi:N-acetylneuraminic acid mutarotase